MIQSLLLALTTFTMMASDKTFTNPVFPYGDDPWVVKQGEMYYYNFATGPNHTGEYSQQNAVWVRGSKSLLHVFSADAALAWEPPAGTKFSQELWAPELHRLGDAWYIYVAADDGDNKNHRMQVLRRTNDDPRGEFEHLGELRLPEDKWAIDGTVMELNGQLYFIWSGWPGDRNELQALYICKMNSPTEAVGERVMISEPTLAWERHGNNRLPQINEGPTAFTHSGKTFVSYAANGSWSDDYCVGVLELTGDDPMKAENWKKHPEPLIATGNGMVAPGHPSVVKSPDESEWWLVYHTATHPGAGWDRHVNLQRMTFDEKTGVPVVGTPVNGSQTVPSGEPGE